jgi:hypothetical protein
MNRRTIAASICIAAFISCTAATFVASLPDPWRGWKYFREVILPQQELPRTVSLQVPDDVYPSAQHDLEDVRIIDDANREVPYIPLDRRVEISQLPIRAKLIERSFSPDKYTELVLQITDKSATHNGVALDVAKPDFFSWVEIAVSDDGQDWRVIKDRAPIFRFRLEGHAGSQQIDYPDSIAPFVRVRILSPEVGFRNANVRLFEYNKVQESYRPANIPLEPRAENERTVWTATLPAQGLPVTQVEFSTSQPEFDRNVIIETSRDGSEWIPGEPGGEIYRFNRDNSQTEKLTVKIGGVLYGRHIRITIFNGSDPPLESVTAQLMTSPRIIYFVPQPQRSYTFLYGQSQISAPSYDLARTIDRRQLASAPAAQLGPQQINSNYDDPRPWTEKHGIVLWAALIIAAVCLGAAALASLRSSTAGASKAN